MTMKKQQLILRLICQHLLRDRVMQFPYFAKRFNILFYTVSCFNEQSVVQTILLQVCIHDITGSECHMNDFPAT